MEQILKSTNGLVINLQSRDSRILNSLITNDLHYILLATCFWPSKLEYLTLEDL